MMLSQIWLNEFRERKELRIDFDNGLHYAAALEPPYGAGQVESALRELAKAIAASSRKEDFFTLPEGMKLYQNPFSDPKTAPDFSNMLEIKATISEGRVVFESEVCVEAGKYYNLWLNGGHINTVMYDKATALTGLSGQILKVGNPPEPMEVTLYLEEVKS